MHYDEENFVGLLETYCYTKAAGWERSFGNAGGSAHSSAGRNSGGPANNSSLSAHNAGSADGRWHSFGPSSGASQRGRVVSDFGVPCAGASVGVVMFGEAVGVVTVGDRGWGWGGWGFGVGWPYWGFLLGTGLGVCLGSLVVWLLRVRPVASLLLLLLSGL